MHILAAEPGRIDDGEAAVDLGQSPGEIVILSSADTELAAFAEAAERLGAELPSVRLANLMNLSHPYSVDLYGERTLARARFVLVRLMGGPGYWPYGIEHLRALARAGGAKVAVVPGEDRWDASLAEWSNVPPDMARLLWRYSIEGGPTNAANALRLMAHLIGRGTLPAPPEPLPRAGCYRPEPGPLALAEAISALDPHKLLALVVFYRALLLGGSAAPVDALVAALEGEGMAVLAVHVAGLKDRDSVSFLEALFEKVRPSVVLNGTAFAAGSMGGASHGTVLDRPGAPVLQVIFSGSTEEAWRGAKRGLGPNDLTMNIVLPEVDGRIHSRAVSFKEVMRSKATDSRIARYRPVPDRIAFVAQLASAWARLRQKSAKERRIALVLANYPAKDGRLANGVGLDTPEGAIRIAAALRDASYETGEFPRTSADLMTLLLSGPTNAPDSAGRNGGEEYPLDAYRAFLARLGAEPRGALIERWGAPEADPRLEGGAFRLAVHRFGNLAVAIQPSRGYEVDPKSSYHDPALVPPHNYLAFHAWLREVFRADAIVMVGKHGNLEWLPGKALALSPDCWPEIALGATPVVYPFIVNDPGEGAQAKRRAGAVIVDHLMPAVTRAGLHGPLAELETLVDEYALAAGADPRRREHLAREIMILASRHGIDRDLGFDATVETDAALRLLDGHLCDLKELHIRDGLHILGQSPSGSQRTDTLAAIARVPRGGGGPTDASLLRALAADLLLAGFDPLDCDLAADWEGPRPAVLAGLSDMPWRTNGDTVERLEVRARELIECVTPAKAGVHAASRQVADIAMDSGFRWNDESSQDLLIKSQLLLTSPLEGEVGSDRDSGPDREGGAKTSDASAGAPPSLSLPLKGGGDEGGAARLDLARSMPVLHWIRNDLAPALDASGDAEIAAVLTALDGRFVAPGPSGAATRGRPEVLPTGRNFYSVDVRAVPTAAAYALGRAAADAVALRYCQDEGEWPRRIALSAWGTSNMRTGGDDIAEALAFIGAAPVWEAGTGRVTGFRVLPLAELGRPRIDVTFRISGMFRDAFPTQIDLLHSAFAAVAALDEPAEANPLAADRDAPRIFGSKPGAYGAGLQALIDSGAWGRREELADAFLAWSGFAYGGGREGEGAGNALRQRLAGTDAVVHNQDNREHDILDSDDYYQFQGGLSAAVEMLKGSAPRLFHGDHSLAEKPVVRDLSEEIARVVRGRAANPKWIAGVMRHGYKGAFEMAASLDYLFAFAATTDAVGDHHFDQLYEAYMLDPAVAGFIAENNPPALAEMAARFAEAIERGLWAPRANSVRERLADLGSGRVQ